MKLYKLPFTVLRMVGSDFINQFTSNELSKTQNAFIDRLGKIVATFYQVKVNSNEVLIVLGKEFVERLREHLKKFLMLSDAKLEETNFKAYLDIEGPAEGEYKIPVGKGHIILSSEELETTVSEEEFLAFRLENNMPLQGSDYDQDLLVNVDPGLGSVNKGCYLGQEIVARIMSRPMKKRRKKLDVLLGAIMLLGIALISLIAVSYFIWTPPIVDPVQITKPPIGFQYGGQEVTIIFEKRNCFDECPEYRLTLQGDLTVKHEQLGSMSSPVIGTLSRNELNGILAKTNEINFFNLEDSYKAEGIRYPSITSTVTIGDKTKTIQDNLLTNNALNSFYDEIHDYLGVRELWNKSCTRENCLQDFGYLHPPRS